jgi:replicative DNA helicase
MQQVTTRKPQKEEKPSFSKFGKDFQESLCQMVLQDRPFADQIMEVLDINFLELHYLRVFIQKIFQYREKYNVHPTYKVMISILRAEITDENPACQQQLRDYFARIHNSELSNSEYIKKTSLEFCKKQKLKEAMIKSVSLLQRSSFDEISKIINDAIKLGDDNNNGYDYIKDFERRFELKVRDPITTGWKDIDVITHGGLGIGELGVVIAPTGCHAKGTKVLLSNGNFIEVENVKPGDRLMGPDSTPRLVGRLHRGKDLMYRITPDSGDPFIVNRGHILSLQEVNDNIPRHNSIQNISVFEYMNANSDFKRAHKLYRVPVRHFDGEQKVLEPYSAGTILGSNRFSQDTQSILNVFKTALFNDRLELLAGFIDAGCSLFYNGFGCVSDSKTLLEDIAFVARSLGLGACVQESPNNYTKTYYRINIFGNCDIIPSKLSKKTALSAISESPAALVADFEVEELEVGDYYGFEVDKDHLYLMDDFTVTHNSGKSMALVHLGTQALKAGKTVVHYTLELADTVTATRYDSCLTKIPLSQVRAFKEEIYEKVLDLEGVLIIKEYPTKTASTRTLKNHLEKLKMRDIQPDMVIVDYGDLLRPVSGKNEKRHELESIYEELRGMAQEYRCCVYTASQTNRCLSVEAKLHICRRGEDKLIDIGAIELGDHVHTHLGRKRVSYVSPIEKQRTYRITLKSGRTIECTSRHMFPTSEGKLSSIDGGLSLGEALLVEKDRLNASTLMEEM